MLDEAALTAALLTASVEHENATKAAIESALVAGVVDAMTYGSLPQTPAGRLQFATEMLHGTPVRDAAGNLTGERDGGGLINVEQFLKIIGAPPFEPVEEPAPRRRRKR